MDFYGKLKTLKEVGIERASNMIRSVILENFDAAWRRYLLLMNNAKDIVAFQSYTDKDPLISYYNIAQTKFSEVMYDSMVGYIKDLIQMPIENYEENDPDNNVDFNKISDYLFQNMKNMESLKDIEHKFKTLKEELAIDEEDDDQVIEDDEESQEQDQIEEEQMEQEKIDAIKNKELEEDTEKSKDHKGD